MADRTGGTVRRVRLRFLGFLRAACVAGLAAAGAATALAQGVSCESGGARVTFDPVETLVYVPDDGPLDVTPDGKGGISVRTTNAPTSFPVAITKSLQRNATAVRFRFDKTATATLVVETTSPPGGLRWFAIERDSTTCNSIDTVVANVGTNQFTANGVNSNPFQVDYNFDPGLYRVEVSAPFQKDVVYRVVFYAQSGKGEPQAYTVTWEAFKGRGAATADPALKILPPGANPLTGCPGTDLSNLTAAYRAESIARAHFASLNAVYEQATANGVDTKKLKKVKVSDRDVEIFRDYVRLSLEHLECARKLVEGRTDLDPAKKSLALSEIARAVGRDEQALTDLDTPVLATGARRDLELLARLSQASLSLGSALDIKESAAQAIDPGWTKPGLEAALDLGATLQDAAALAAAREDGIEAALTEYRDKLESLRETVRAEGAAGLDRVIASNAAERCREFLELTVLGQLNEIAVAFEQQRREQELARLMNTPAPKDEVKATAAVVKSVTRSAAGATKAVGGTGKPLTPPKRGFSSNSESRRFDAVLRGINRQISGQTGIGAVIVRKRQYEKLLGTP